MSTVLAAVLAWNPLLLYNTGFELSVAAALGILLLQKPPRSLVECILPGLPKPTSNLLSPRRPPAL